ncbi:MAG: undecaprenyl-diphosphate phosphatase [Clostridia bacterium]|nr:undecaprenyl-diphosphate phosphatase [Clostridia bacterium]
MELLIALFFGVVQGATEFLPISGGAHLAMIQNFNQTIFGEALFSPTLTFDILLRLGTLLAIIFVFFSDIKLLWNEFLCIISELWKRQFSFHTDRPYRKLFYMLFVTTLFLIPAVILSEYTGAYLNTLPVIAGTMMVTGVVNFFIDKIDKFPKKLWFSGLHTTEFSELSGGSYLKKAVTVGVFQLASVIPGLSRCAMNILGGLYAGFRRDATVRYAFLSAIPVLAAKILLQAVTVLQDGIRMNWVPYLLGMIAAFFSGVVSIEIIRTAVRKGYCKRFGVYCLVIGIIILVIQMRG